MGERPWELAGDESLEVELEVRRARLRRVNVQVRRRCGRRPPQHVVSVRARRVRVRSMLGCSRPPARRVCRHGGRRAVPVVEEVPGPEVVEGRPSLSALIKAMLRAKGER